MRKPWARACHRHQPARTPLAEGIGSILHADKIYTQRLFGKAQEMLSPRERLLVSSTSKPAEYAIAQLLPSSKYKN